MKRVFLAVGALLAGTAAVLLLQAGRGATDMDALASDDLLLIIRDGCENAVSAIKTGRGEVTVHRTSRASSGSIKETDTVYALAFDGDNYLLSATETVVKTTPASGSAEPPTGPGAKPGEVRRWKVAADGNKAVGLDVDHGIAYIGELSPSGNAAIYHWNYVRDVQVLDRGVSHFRIPEDPAKRKLLRVERRETVADSECFVVRYSYQAVQGGRKLTGIVYMFVDPKRGYSIPRQELWAEGEGLDGRVLIERRDTEVRCYDGGIWCPAQSTEVKYNEEGEEQSRTVTTYGPGFRINAPVRSDELELTLPSGTKVRDETLGKEYTLP